MSYVPDTATNLQQSPLYFTNLCMLESSMLYA